MLKRLGINYRELSCSNREFFYCKIPANGLIFDLKYGEEYIIRLWRLVRTALISKARMRCEYRQSSYPHTLIGIEVADKGDVSLYVEQKTDRNDFRREARIVRMHEGYFKMIFCMDFEKKSACKLMVYSPLWGDGFTMKLH